MKIGRAIFARDFFLMENEVFDQLLHPAITIILLLQLSDTMMKLSYQMRLE